MRAAGAGPPQTAPGKRAGRVAVKLTFLGDMPAGAAGEAWQVVSLLGLTLFVGPVDTASVAPDLTLTFPNVTATAGAANLAFCVLAGGMPIWRSGPVDATQDNQFMIFNPPDLQAQAGQALDFPPASFAHLSPALPASGGATTVKTITGITPGAGTISVTGTAVSTQYVAPVDVAFTYVFSLQPATQHPDSRVLLDVATVSLDVTGNNGSWFGWLINPLVNALLAVFTPPSAPVQAAVQQMIDAAVQKALAANSPVAGATAAVSQATLDATSGLSVQAWAGVPMNSVCCGTVCSGSVKVRPAADIAHLRAIRDGMLLKSPEGFAYASFLRDNNPLLMRLLVDNPDLLAAADAVVAQVLREFTATAPESGVLSAASAEAVTQFLARFAAAAPAELAVAAAGLAREVHKFVGVPAGPVLQASWALAGAPADMPKVPAPPAPLPPAPALPRPLPGTPRP